MVLDSPLLLGPQNSSASDEAGGQTYSVSRDVTCLFRFVSSVNPGRSDVQERFLKDAVSSRQEVA